MKRSSANSTGRQLYSTGEVASQLGIPITTQKNWERRGYLLPFEYAGRHRRYTVAGLHRLARVKALTERYRFQAQVMRALEQGEAADVGLPPAVTVEAPLAKGCAPNREGLLDLLARNAQLFVEQRQLAKELASSKEELEYHSRFESLITALSTNFINLPLDQIDGGLNQALRAIGEFAGVDRSYLVQLHENATKMDTSHEWCAAGIELAIHRVKEASVDTLPWAMERLSKFEVVYVPCVAGLPPEASAEIDRFQAQGIKSIILIPIAYQGSAVGFAGFDSVREEKTWSDDDIRLLKIVGEMLANVLGHKRANEQLRASEARYSALFSAVDAGIVVVDKDGQVVDANERAQAGGRADQVLELPRQVDRAPQ